jgi:hypothetical protein
VVSCPQCGTPVEGSSGGWHCRNGHTTPVTVDTSSTDWSDTCPYGDGMIFLPLSDTDEDADKDSDSGSESAQ